MKNSIEKIDFKSISIVITRDNFKKEQEELILGRMVELIAKFDKFNLGNSIFRRS